MAFKRALVIAVAFCLSLLSDLNSVVASSKSSSPPQLQRLAAEGTFVRGMMAADHQLVYMASETPRGGGVGGEEAVDSEGGCADGSGPMMPVHHAVDKARDAALAFAGVVRRRAFLPLDKPLRLENDDSPP